MRPLINAGLYTKTGACVSLHIIANQDIQSHTDFLNYGSNQEGASCCQPRPVHPFHPLRLIRGVESAVMPSDLCRD